MSKHIRKILIYSHNTTGLGHIFRTLAIVTGIKKWRSDIEFLVVSGTSVPHVLLRHGIEVIKLPSVKKCSDGTSYELKPRYLKDTSLDGILEFRMNAIMGALEFFKPGAVMVEHYAVGLSGEIIPILKRKKALSGTPDEFLLAYLSRGIMSSASQGRQDGIGYAIDDYLPLYDSVYVFDDRETVDVNAEFLGSNPEFEPKIRYLGRITDKHIDEIQDSKHVLTRLRLSDQPLILLNLSRQGDIVALHRQLISAFDRTGLDKAFQIVVVIDPYLDRSIAEKLQKNPMFGNVRFLPFFYPLIDLINASELVICRAGYNIINELLLTNSKALVIPERHASGEQERRAEILPQDNIVVMSEKEVLASPPDQTILELVDRKSVPLHFLFDKYKIGRDIITDLENLTATRLS